KVEPVVRHGEKPTFLEYSSRADLVKKVVEAVAQAEEAGFKSIAIIGKTDDECKKIMKLLKGELQQPVQLLKENEEIKSGHIVIVPSYLAKGLEFDAVVVVLVDEIYSIDEIDIKLLYVAMTRPMHQLYL